jgi:hypothetical protein
MFTEKSHRSGIYTVMFETLQQFVIGTDPLLQWVAVMIIATIPFVESYFGSALGIAAGVPVPVAIGAAIVGNCISMIAFVTLGDKLRLWRNVEEKPQSPRRQKLKNAYEKYGVAGVSLFGQTILPSQITSMAMVTFGAHKALVIFWQTISIILWGVGIGLLAMYGLNVF